MNCIESSIYSHEYFIYLSKFYVFFDQMRKLLKITHYFIRCSSSSCYWEVLSNISSGNYFKLQLKVSKYSRRWLRNTFLSYKGLGKVQIGIKFVCLSVCVCAPMDVFVCGLTARVGNKCSIKQLDLIKFVNCEHFNYLETIICGLYLNAHNNDN